MKTMTHRMYQVDAFSNHVFGGNPAAVLVMDTWLPDRVMQAIANENNLSETAFVRANNDNWDLRWFTSVREVDFCGHATLATAHILTTKYGKQDSLLFNTRVGEITVSCSGGLYTLNIPAFEPEPVKMLPPSIVDVFDVPPRVIFQNFENLFVELYDEGAVRNFIPNLSKISTLSEGGLVITALGETFDFVSRYFAPSGGIPEDPVTGSTHSTLVPYWANRLGKTKLLAFQASERGGILNCKLDSDRVLLSGYATTFMEADIFLPS